jgi:hypothetical protein
LSTGTRINLCGGEDDVGKLVDFTNRTGQELHSGTVE